MGQRAGRRVAALVVMAPFVNLPADRMVTVDEVINEADWLKSAIYQEFLKPLNIPYMGADVGGGNDAICRLYGLTPAESTLTLKLLDGLTVDEAAEELSISRNTARCQLRATFAKTGVTRQTELLRLLLGG